MIALSIDDVKGFMVKLLKEEIFDSFDLHSIIINSFARFEIYPSAEAESHLTWANLRVRVLDIIKGEIKPKSIKIVFGRSADVLGFESGSTYFTNIHFEDGKINITTGISKKSFSLEKTDEKKWDSLTMKFLDDSGIKYSNQL